METADPLAYENFRDDQYDLVLLDIKMPVVDGFLLHRKIRKIDSRIIICFLSHSQNMLFRDHIANDKFSQRYSIKYKLAPKNKKDDFWVDLKMKLVLVEVNVNPMPNIEYLQSIQIAKLI